MKGSIRRRSKSSWELTVDLGRDHDGRRQRKFVNVKGKKADAERRLRDLLARVEGGMPLDSSKATVREFLERWLKDYAETNTSPRTVQGYRGVIQRYLVPHLGRTTLVKLMPQHVQSLYASMLGRGLSPRTTLHTHRILKEALGHAVKWRLLTRNVCDAVDPPRPRRKEMTSLDASEVQRLLDAAAGSPYGAVIYLAVYTGMRRSELLGLMWSAVDLDRKALSVTHGLVRITGKGLKLVEPKTARSRRLVSLPESAAAILSGLKVKQREERQTLGLPWDESHFVFSDPQGTPFDPDTITHAFAKVVKTARVPRVRFHDLRHTHATLMLKQGVHSKVVSERLGHASIAITLDTYSHVLPGLQESAADGFEELLQVERRALVQAKPN